MYRSASTDIPGMSRRPFRLSGYQRANFVIPTQSMPGQPCPGPVSGGLGALDLRTLTSNPLVWGAALFAGYWFFLRKR
jgi:hypothetical protein